jgi:hypothetical protein
VDALIAAAAEMRTAKEDAAGKKTAADEAQAALAAKEQELQRKVRGRQDAIKAGIAAIPAPAAAPPGGAKPAQPQPQPANP